jgi:hypothetical protein
MVLREYGWDARDRMGKYGLFGLAILVLRCMIFTIIKTFRFGGSNDLGLSFSLLYNQIWRLGERLNLLLR